MWGDFTVDAKCFDYDLFISMLLPQSANIKVENLSENWILGGFENSIFPQPHNNFDKWIGRGTNNKNSVSCLISIRGLFDDGAAC